MRRWKLWAKGPEERVAQGIEPLLASWEKSTHPAQVRLRAYLAGLMAALGPLPETENGRYLQLDVDVVHPERLLRHYDLENYLTPLFGGQWLDSSKFKLVCGRKRVGGGSCLTIGEVQPADVCLVSEGWAHFSCAAGANTSGRAWKENIGKNLQAAGHGLLPDGPVEVQLAWRCSPQRNWTNLWKPTGDAMGPVLGVERKDHPFNPRDDRITALTLYLNPDPKQGHEVELGDMVANHTALKI